MSNYKGPERVLDEKLYICKAFRSVGIIGHSIRDLGGLSMSGKISIRDLGGPTVQGIWEGYR